VKNKVRVNKYEINNTHKPRPWLSVLVYEISSLVVWVVEEGRGREPKYKHTSHGPVDESTTVTNPGLAQ
jgi:hypothetical protein